jgi:hypothetical protein
MSRKLVKVIAPAAWSSAIVNNDYSGLGAGDKKELNNFLADLSLSFSDVAEVSSSFEGLFDGKFIDLALYSFLK